MSEVLMGAAEAGRGAWVEPDGAGDEEGREPSDCGDSGGVAQNPRLVRTITAVDAEAGRLEALIQRQETVDLVRRDERERVRMSEALMGLLLRLDAVPGADPTVREMRRGVSRRIVGIQDVLDGVVAVPENSRTIGGWDWDWDEMVRGIEEEAVRERGGGWRWSAFARRSWDFDAWNGSYVAFDFLDIRTQLLRAPCRSESS
ncbi:hypothetical protein Sjap_025132 [Stephania japonica]|uniref:BAG domain-containing protein n=1 Tax=Stephania japonica TaxID=461633 RepID=A0AAP0HHP3_9MAGN